MNAQLTRGTYLETCWALCRWNFPSLYSPLLKKLAVKTKCKSIKVMDQGDWKKGLVVPGSFLTRTTSRAISTKFEEEIIPLKTLKTLENLKQATGQIYAQVRPPLIGSTILSSLSKQFFFFRTAVL